MLDRKTLIFSDTTLHGLETSQLLLNTNLHEFTTVILDPSLVFADVGAVGASYFPAFSSQLAKIGDWVREGNSLILVLGRSHVKQMDDDGDGNYVCVHEFPPLDCVELDYASGKRVEYCGPPAAEGLFQSWLSELEYKHIIRAPNLIPLLKTQRATKGPPQVVGGMASLGSGMVFVVPRCRGELGSANHIAYLEALANLPARVAHTPHALPGWAGSYRTADEVEAQGKIGDLRAQISKLESAVQGEEERLSDAARLKVLFVGSGGEFVTAVSDALSELGIRVIDGPHPRADLLAFDDARGILAIEAKGLDGCAREANLRQTERRVADVKSARAASAEGPIGDVDLQGYADQLTALGVPTEQETEVKGLMVIGTFRKTPLEKRIEPDFPDPVMRALSRSSMCALTGLQLLGMILQVREDPSMKQKLVEQIFTTNGPLELQSSWKDFLIGP
jgi:hypothetical protein